MQQAEQKVKKCFSEESAACAQTQPLVSVIVAVYKVEPYVERCVRSIMEQTYRNLEIILVDDGSPDKSGEICDRLALEDARITVYHQTNYGASAARNLGVSKSCGAYIAYIDFDDYIAKNYIERLVFAAQTTGAEVAVCGYSTTDSAHFAFDEAGTVQVVPGKQACKMQLQASGENPYATIFAVPWAKLMRREIAERFPFTYGIKWEDTDVSYRWLYASEKVAICSDRLYAYYQNNDGIIANLRRTEALDTDRMQVLIRRAEFFEREREKELARLSWARALRFLYCDSMEYDGRCDAQLKSCLHGRWYTGYISAGMLLRVGAYYVCPASLRVYRKLWQYVHK